MQFPLFKDQTTHDTNYHQEDRKNTLRDILSSDLDFVDNINVNSRHYWHSFPAKFPPQLPALFIKYLTNNDAVILDPMMGSGTTLIEAGILGRKSFGIDIDPLAILNANAKIKNIDKRKVEAYLNSIVINSIKRCNDEPPILENHLTERFDSPTLEFIDYWFSKRIQLELMSLLLEIEKIIDDDIRNILYSVFSSIIITKSGGVSLAMDLAHTRPHRVNDKKVKSAITEFSLRTRKIVSTNNNELKKCAIIIEGDAKNIPFRNEIADLIITSPPYANNAIDYMRAHKFSLVWLGYKITDLKEIRKKYIGAESRIDINFEEYPEIIREKITLIDKVNNKKSYAFQRYCYELLHAIKEMHRVLKRDSPCILVVASSKICGIDVETHTCLTEIGRMIGFEIVGIGKRIINRNRRMMPYSKEKSKSKIEDRMHQEYVIGFWKD